MTTIPDHKSCTCLVLGERHLAVGRLSCKTELEYPEDSSGRCDWYRKRGGGMRAHSKQVKELGARGVVHALPLHNHQSETSKVQRRPGLTDHVVPRLLGAELCIRNYQCLNASCSLHLTHSATAATTSPLQYIESAGSFLSPVIAACRPHAACRLRLCIKEMVQQHAIKQSRFLWTGLLSTVVTLLPERPDRPCRRCG